VAIHAPPSAPFSQYGVQRFCAATRTCTQDKRPGDAVHNGTFAKTSKDAHFHLSKTLAACLGENDAVTGRTCPEEFEQAVLCHMRESCQRQI